MSTLGLLLVCVSSGASAAAQTVKGSFGLLTSDPICIQCDYATVSWYGGIPPYALSVSGYHNSYQLTNVGSTQTNQMKWHVNFPTGTRLWFRLDDANKTDIYTNVVTVTASSDASCVNVTNPLVTDPSATTSAVSVISSLSSTSTKSASVTSTSVPLPGSGGDQSSTGPIAGGIVGGIIILLLLLCLIWCWRRTKKSAPSLARENQLGLNEGRHVLQVEPFIPEARAANDNMRSPKMRSLVSDSSLLAHSNASNHQSTTIPSSSPSLGLNSVQSTSSEPTISELSPRTPVSPVKRTRTGNQVFAPVQEQDAGVTLLDGSRLEEHSTLPPAYDSSWMRN